MSPRLALAGVHLVAKRYFPGLSGPPGSRLRAVRTIITEYARRLRGKPRLNRRNGRQCLWGGHDQSI